MSKVDGPDPYRLVLDESSFDFRSLGDEEIEQHLDQLNVTLDDIRTESDLLVARPPDFYYTLCRDELTLADFLYPSPAGRATRIDPDTLRLFASRVDRCPEWLEDDGEFIDEVRIGAEAASVEVFSVAYALVNRLRGRAVACLAFPGRNRRGLLNVIGMAGSAEIFFFARPRELPAFWRSIFRAENIESPEFFGLARHAFPGLTFHDDLRFQRFDGSYTDVRDRVVEVLAGLNDHFLKVFRECAGLPYDVQARLGQHRIDVSPESPKTRATETLMKKRDVLYAGRTVRCEWHAKLERHRNRIHFAPLSNPDDDQILVGIFVDHLPT